MRSSKTCNAICMATLAGAVLLAVSACTTVGPDYKVPEKAAINNQDASRPFLSAHERIYAAGDLPAKWWRLYDDPILDRLIEQALAANTDLRIASANLARARAVLEEAQVPLQPSVSVSAAPAYGRASAAAKGLSERLPDMWSQDVGVGVSYQIDLFGKIARGIESASADEQVAQAAYDLVRITVAADTARAYAESCSSGYQIRVAKRSVDLQQQFLSSTQDMVRFGRGTALDTSRARSQLEQRRAALPPLEAQRRSALYRLAVLTGQVPSALVGRIGQCERIPQLANPIPVGDGASLLKRRPDIRQAERSLASATARIGVATADLYPNISLGFSVGSTGPMDRLGHVDAFRWGLGPLISWTFPDTGSARSRIAQAEAGNDAALARFDASVLNALRETETSLTSYARELDRNRLLKAARDQSALASKQAKTLYRYGRTDFLTALDAERTLANDESTLAASSAKLASEQIGLFLALGGGWETGSQSKKQ